MQATATTDSLIGFTLVNKYKVLRQIGRGGMGIVYEAEHVELGKRVAIKLMLEKYQDDGEAIARFKREALAAGKIGNPHIIDVSDIGTAPDGRMFVVMELLIGASLSEIIEKTGPMPPVRAIQIMRQVLRAVGAAHAKNIIHRDLKPDNIFLVNQDDHHDFVKLLDFGISKVVDQAAEIAATKLTTTGMVMGTPLYMAPEQAMGATTDGLADVYALGVILYEMLAGQPPFNGATYPILVAKLLTADPPLLSELRPGLPASLVAAVHRALEKEPEKRFPSCDAFAAALPNERTNSGSLEMAQTLDSGRLAAAGQLGISRGTRPKNAQTTGASSAAAIIAPGHAPKRSRLPILFGAVGVGLAVGSIAIIALSRGGGSSSDPSAPKAMTVSPITTGSDQGSGSGSAPPPKPNAEALVPKPGTPTGHLHVKSTPTGAAVTVDGTPIGNAPIEVTVAAGPHHIHVELAGYQSMDEDDDVAPKEHAATNIMLPKLAGGVPRPPPIVKTLKPQPLPHVEPVPPGGVAPPPPQTPPTSPGAPGNPYDEPVVKKPPPTTPGTKPNPYH